MLASLRGPLWYNTVMHRALSLAFLSLLLLLPACAAPQRAETLTTPRDPRALSVFDGRTGARVPWESLASACAQADVVVIGENHGHPAGLAGAAALFDDILARAEQAALSLEFFERDEQPRLDDYLTGVTDEKTFRERTRRTDGNYPPGHRAMVEAAKAAGRPVIAANAPRPYVSFARRESYERLATLTSEQRRLFRIPDALPEGRYADEFRKLMSGMAGHGHQADPDAQARMLDGMLRAQSLWDWTMADSIARAAADARPVVHVVGRFHADFRGGLIQALERLRPGLSIVTISFAADDADTLRPDDQDRADFVIYAGPAPKEK